MTTWLGPSQGQHGSTMLITLVLVFVMALLGLALYHLGAIESRLVYVSEDDARVLQIAQVGVERALAQLQADIVTNGGSPLWASGASGPLCSGGAHRGCSDRVFHPAATGFVSNTNFDTGSYNIELMQVPEKTYPVPCTASTISTDIPGSTNKICDDLIFVRSTGTLTKSREGYSATRTIQLLAQASLAPGKCLICGGLTGVASSGTPINGNVKIAGSIQVAGIEGVVSVDLGGNAQQTNSYAQLNDSPYSLAMGMITKLPLVCPLGRICSGGSGLVESLGATLKVALPVNSVAVRLNNNSRLGLSGDQPYPVPGRTGKGPLDGIFVADGCVMPCTDNFDNATLNSNVFVDDNNITRPYPAASTQPFPQLTASWRVGSVTYTHLACLQGSSCTPPVGPPTTQEYFVSRAANLTLASCVPSCGPLWVPGYDGTGAGPLTYLTGCPNPPGTHGCPSGGGQRKTGLGDGDTDPGPFEITVSFYDKTGFLVPGKICWDRSNPSRPPGSELVSTPTASGVPRFTLEFGSPDCDQPSSVDNPLLLYIPSAYPTQTGFTINRNGGPNPYFYRGSALIMTNGFVQIEETLYSCQTTISQPACSNSHGNGGPDMFTRDSSLTIMTTGDLNVGKEISGITIMGLFYAGCDPTDSACGVTKGRLSSQKQSNVIGVAVGYRLCFAAGNPPCDASSAGNVPSFFQVIPDKNNLVAQIGIPGETSAYTIAPWAPYWTECKRNADGTLKKDVTTDLCPYTP
jgi:hypothetical protein